MRHLFIAAIICGTLAVPTAVAQNLEASGKEFRNSCASCHGTDGKGAGFLVKLFKGISPPDLTTMSKRNDGQFPFLKVLQVIDGRAVVPAHGDRDMPVWGDRYKVEAGDIYGPYGSEQVVRARVLELVYFVQSIQEQ